VSELRKHTSREEELHLHEIQFNQHQSNKTIKLHLEVIWEKRRHPKDFFSWKNPLFLLAFSC
jgi:hypothetical protein